MTYKVKNPITPDIKNAIIQGLKDSCDYMNSRSHQPNLMTFTPPSDEGELKIYYESGIVHDFGRIIRYPHIYDYIPGQYDARAVPDVAKAIQRAQEEREKMIKRLIEGE